MRYIFIFCFAFCWQVCLGQFNRFNFKYARGNKTISTLAFYRQRIEPDSDIYELRRIPFDMGDKFPFYISLGSWDRKFVHYEFFRIDTTRYFAREYFRGNFPQGEVVKSFGEELVDKKVSKRFLFGLFDPFCGDKMPSFPAVEQLLIKDGVWIEFENHAESPTFWRGDYLNDKKIGIWNRMLSFDTDTLLLGKIDYQKDSTKIYGDNGIREKLLSDLQNLLPGKWSCLCLSLSGQGTLKFFKDTSTGTSYVPECYFMPSQYLFDKTGKFQRNGPVWNESNDYLNRGTWQIGRRGDRTFIYLFYVTGKKCELELLYYTEKEGLFMNLTNIPDKKTLKKKLTTRKINHQGPASLSLKTQ